ncbi:MAG: 1-deoxy-D-xylulose-5-phosphate synthase [Deltaproteobacteria bacterium]|nr:1-deoxy-D-xylulose-5-phosphate synthase [Deltaproteobacteria bacterium]
MYKLLDKIDSPVDLKKLPQEQLPLVATELREMILETVSRTGGHLASSLGAVEITIALHYVFDGTSDDIIWDVGHQAYPHKILTGRREQFKTLRQFQGMSGFPKRSESPYDAFGVGHASTSISAALGMTVARDLRQGSNKVIAIIGDGSMTAGLAFEGLNQAGHLNRDLMVILNDNEMSISKNVGALSSFLSRKITGRFATKLKKEIEGIFHAIPFVGDRLITMAKRAEDSLISLITPGMLFEGLGFHYIGPIDGHDIGGLIKTFTDSKDLEGPLLIHLLTKKGKGCAFAEEEPSRFHGLGPFNIKSGKSEGVKKRSYTDVFSEALLEIAEGDNRVVAITAAMPEGTGLAKFEKRYPDRFFDVGIAEQHAITFAAGLATKGFVPVTGIYSTFLQRAYDEVMHDVCLQNLPVVIALDRAGIVGQDGPTHHGLFDISFLRHLPKIIIMAPKDEEELRHLLYTAVKAGCPAVVRYPRGNCAGVEEREPMKELPLGKAEVLREGGDITILVTGTMVYPALEAAEAVGGEGIAAGVVNCRFIKPLDEELIVDLASRKTRLLTVEESALQGGFGSAVLELLEDRGVTCEIKRMGVPDRFVEHGTQQELRALLGLDSSGIADKVREMVGKCRGEKESVSINCL